MAPSFLRRSLAFLLDAVIALLLYLFVGGLFAIAYLILRDGLWGGRSIGKAVLSLRVIRREGGVAIGLADSLKRNLVFVIPLVNAAVSASVFEAVNLYFDEERLRLGDRLAGTRVVSS